MNFGINHHPVVELITQPVDLQQGMIPPCLPKLFDMLVYSIAIIMIDQLLHHSSYIIKRSNYIFL